MGGPKSVSSLQYDAVMAPLVSVEINREADSYEDLMKNSAESDGDLIEFKVHRIVPGKPVKRSRLSSKDADSADDGSSLRQRKKQDVSLKSQGVEDVTKMMTSWKLEDNPEHGTYESNEMMKDPIKWFGVLVPQSLRQSQQHFVTGASIYIDYMKYMYYMLYNHTLYARLRTSTANECGDIEKQLYVYSVFVA